MSYQVIARKYRPQCFADVVGQEHVTQTLANAIASGRIAHAYLFCGPRGTGKTTIARIFAKCLNCTGGPKVDFPLDDPKAVEIAEGRAIDVLEIDGASNNGVEQVRELRETVKYAPASSKFKIYIIDEVHMLSTQAFNALLKTLEEPPAHVKFFFATTDPEKVLLTILSRCQRFDLRRIPASLIAQHLTFIAKQEKVDIDAEALHAIARGADGGLRDAESALDQLISFCGTTIVEADVLSMFGLASRRQVLALALAVLQGDPGAALRELNELARHGKDLSRLLSDLLGHFRNLVIYQVSGGDLNLLEVSENEIASLKEQGALAKSEALTRVMDVLTDAEGRLRDAASKKIFVEVALLRAIQARNAVSIDTVLGRLRQLRAEGEQSGVQNKPAAATASAPAPASPPVAPPARTVAAPLSPPPAATTAPAPAPISAPPPTEASPDIARAPAPPVGAGVELPSLWANLVEAVGRASAFTRTYFIEAHPVSFTRGVLTIGFDPEFAEHISLVNNAKTHTLLQTKLQELGHPGTQIKFIQAERPTDWAPPTPAAIAIVPQATPASASSDAPKSADLKREKPAAKPAGMEDFKNDPLIQKALEIFKGQIIEVRT